MVPDKIVTLTSMSCRSWTPRDKGVHCDISGSSRGLSNKRLKQRLLRQALLDENSEALVYLTVSSVTPLFSHKAMDTSYERHVSDINERTKSCIAFYVHGARPPIPLIHAAHGY